MERKHLKNILILVAALYLCFFLFSFYEWHIMPLLANQYVNRAEAYAQYMDFGRAFNEYEKALGLDTHILNPYARYRYGMSALSYARLAKYFEIEPEKTILVRAIDLQNENELSDWPRFTRNYTVAGQLANALFESGEQEYREKADEYFQKALIYSPKRSSVYLDMARTNAIAKDYSGAEQSIEKALSINEHNVEAKWQLLLLRIKQERPDKAWALYKQLGEIGYGLFSFDALNELAMTWGVAGDKETALRFYKKLAIQWPGILHYQRKVEELSKGGQ